MLPYKLHIFPAKFDRSVFKQLCFSVQTAQCNTLKYEYEKRNMPLMAVQRRQLLTAQDIDDA